MDTSALTSILLGVVLLASGCTAPTTGGSAAGDDAVDEEDTLPALPPVDWSRSDPDPAGYDCRFTSGKEGVRSGPADRSPPGDEPKMSNPSRHLEVGEQDRVRLQAWLDEPSQWRSIEVNAEGALKIVSGDTAVRPVESDQILLEFVIEGTADQQGSLQSWAMSSAENAPYFCNSFHYKVGDYAPGKDD